MITAREEAEKEIDSKIEETQLTALESGSGNLAAAIHGEEAATAAAYEETATVTAANRNQTAAADESGDGSESAYAGQTAAAGYENRWGISLSDEEIDLLAKIVWLEARGEPVMGQEAVVEVVFNRMASEQFPDTLYAVLSQENPVQFCSWKNRDKAEPTEKEYNSIYEVLNGNTDILRNDTLYFSREALTAHLDVTIGEHSFCY